jgi:ATP-dependent DNA ligase
MESKNAMPERKNVPPIPDGSEWIREIKLGPYRALAVKFGSNVTLFSSRRKFLNLQFQQILKRLGDLPAGTAVDGEMVAIDDSGRPEFNLLQKFRADAYCIHVAGAPSQTWVQRMIA